MARNLYEIYIPFGRRDINCAYLLDIVRETEKFYFGDAVLLDKETGVPVEKYSRFRVVKEKVDCARINRDTVLVVQTFGDSFVEAKENAVAAFIEMAKHWANELQSTLEYNFPLNDRLRSAEERSSGFSNSGEAKDVYTPKVLDI